MAKPSKAQSSSNAKKGTRKESAKGSNAPAPDTGAKAKVKPIRDASKGGQSERSNRFSVSRGKSFLRDVRGEMRKVTWPSRKQLIASTGAVLLAILILGGYIGLLDWGFRSIQSALNL